MMSKIWEKHKAYLWFGVIGIILFLFYYLCLPYHLYHKEQMSLFVCTSDNVYTYLKQPFCLSHLFGDFLTQFYYYVALGPFILSLVLMLYGVAVYRFVYTFIHGWAFLFAVLFVGWEAGRACNLYYPLSGSIAMLGLFVTLNVMRYFVCKRNYLCYFFGVLSLCIGLVLFGWGSWTNCLVGYPNFKQEHLLGVDSEYYFGNHQKALAMLEKEDMHDTFCSYYYNLIQAERGELPQHLLDYYQPAEKALFLPISSKATYHSIQASAEVWYALGDMTFAEHATLLGMIFSPQSQGTRALRRLAEVNLANDDRQAAQKYLRILSRTICHKSWAKSNMKRSSRHLIAATDTLRSANDVTLSLRHLLRNHSDNRMALDYLLCYDLLSKNITAFVGDYKTYAKHVIPSGIYAQAWLIYLTSKGASKNDILKMNIPLSAINEFVDYSRQYAYHKGNGESLQKRFGHSYWFYYHYATLKMEQ